MTLIPLSGRDSRPVSAQVADGLARLLAAGAFLPGERLPAPEELAWRMVLNPTAVRWAYQELAARGALLYDEKYAAYTVAERGNGT